MSSPSPQKRGPDGAAARFRLVRADSSGAAPAPVLDAGQAAVVAHRGGPLRVLAGPGTGKTTTIVEAVVERIRSGVAVEHIMVLTFGRRAAAQLRDRIAARLDAVVREPVARTLHSYAFGVLRMAANLNREPAPRLLSGSEQDIMLRELVAGDLAEGRTDWPAALTPALRTAGFAAELRDLYLRAAERGIGAAQLAALGADRGRPDWIAAARFWRQYLQVSALQKPGAYDAAELIQAAIDTLQTDRRLLELERARRRVLFVDEYQDVDPAQVRLLQLLAAGADELVVVGDPDQSIYAFRGADPDAMDHAPEVFGPMPTVALTTSRRSGAALVAATRNVAGRLGGGLAAHRQLAAAGGQPDGVVEVQLLRSASEEAAYVATTLRRAHLDQDVPWSQMAVVVRSTTLQQAVLRRALMSAGVPLASATTDLPLAEQSVVAALLIALQVVVRPQTLTAPMAEELMLGPLGGADTLTLRRLRRELSRPASADEPDPMIELLADPVVAATASATVPRQVRRLADALAAGRAALAAGHTGEEVLWALWAELGLAQRWERASLAGGSAGQAADRDLDAVIELFAAAARLADALPRAGTVELIEQVSAQQIPLDSSAVGSARGRADAVSIVTAHAAKGLEWDVVCVAGVQEGIWPDLRRRGSLLGSELLVDVVAGHGEVSGLSSDPQLREERRLFYVATTRARRHLLVTAVAGDEEAPSRFLDELDPLPPEVDRVPVRVPVHSLYLPATVAQLRAIAANPAEPASERAAAAAELARLAEAAVRGADPDAWWGLAALSDERGVATDAETVTLSPSMLVGYARCALRTFLERVCGRDDDAPAAALGTLVHRVAQQAPPDATVAELGELLDAGWAELGLTPRWFDDAERVRAGQMLHWLAQWLAGSRAQLTLLATEQDFSAELGEGVRLRGTVDRLERTTDGRLVVVDLKTGKTRPGPEEVAEHPQLGAYQLAVRAGAFADVPGAGEASEPGGAMLVQLGKAGPRTPPQQDQPPLTDPAWIEQAVAEVVGYQRRGSFPAVANSRCGDCPVRKACPAQDGRDVVSPSGSPAPAGAPGRPS